MQRITYFIIPLILFFSSLSYGIDPPSNLRVTTSGSSISDPPDIIDSILIPQSVSRTSGIAPLSVHFTAGFLTSSSNERSFHDNEYSWDFGDPGSGNWGTTGKSKNSAKGPIATHIFESSGSYTVWLTVRNKEGVIKSDSFNILVIDPDIAYSGINTICVSDTLHGDFANAPSGALEITTDNLSTITQYATSRKRILFHRGSSWITSGLTWPGDSEQVTIGAYGVGMNSNEYGIFDNAPEITVTSGTFLSLNYKQNWRIMDLYLKDPTKSNNSFGGSMEMQRQLFLRLKIEGFDSCISWSNWNTSVLMNKDEMVISSCNLSNSNRDVLYAGSERLALLGNLVQNSDVSHVIRVWQAYNSVISHNVMSGSSLTTTQGKHALKLHGPGYYPNGNEISLGTPSPNNGLLGNETKLCIVSDNTFGSSGPWPVAVGPQSSRADERLSDIIFERNRILTDYGSQNPESINVSLHIWGRYITIRNNIIDGTGSSNGYTGINVEKRGEEPAPIGVEVYNNTIYKNGIADGSHNGINFDSLVRDSIVKNNLVSFPDVTGRQKAIDSNSLDLESSNNLLVNIPKLVDPDNNNPLDRDYDLQSDSPCINKGVNVQVFDDFSGNVRPIGVYDIGAFESKY